MTIRPRGEVLVELSAQVELLEQGHRSSRRLLPTSWRSLDDLLPGSGFRAGSTVEWLSSGAGSGAWTLALSALLQATGPKGRLVIIDTAGDFYPPAVGDRCGRLCVVRPASAAESLWAWEQVLRSGGVAGALGELDSAPDAALRRLALAAERGETLGMMVRPAAMRDEPRWADLRLGVEPIASRSCSSGSRRLRLSLLRGRGVRSGRSIEVDWHEETLSLSLAGSLADPAPSRSSRPA
jgi:hypothetical protein